MKKILILGSVLAALSTSALAENFYIRVDGGASFRQSMYGDKDSNQPFNVLGVSLDSKTIGQIGLGFGGYLADNLRADLNFTYFFDAKYDVGFQGLIKSADDAKGADRFSKLLQDDTGTQAQELIKIFANSTYLGDVIPADTLNLFAGAKTITGDALTALTDAQTAALDAAVAANGKKQNAYSLGELKVRSFSIVPRIYYDFWNFGAGNMFFGVGLGYANASAKLPITSVITTNPTVTHVEAVAADANANPPVVAVAESYDLAAAPAAVTGTYELSTKSANNFAWSAHLGFDYKIESMEGLKLNVEYYYSDMGKLGQWTIDSNTLDSNLYLRSHNLTVGLRFDM